MEMFAMMMRSLYLKLLSVMTVVILSAALCAADQPAAMLYSHGTALLNGNSIARSSALFSGDLVQTNADSVVNINATGSSVLVLNDLLVQSEVGRRRGKHFDFETAGDASWQRDCFPGLWRLDRI